MKSRKTLTAWSALPSRTTKPTSDINYRTATSILYKFLTRKNQNNNTLNKYPFLYVIKPPNMKQLFLLFLPFAAFSQESTSARVSVISHQCANIYGLSLSHVWQYEKGFQSIGFEALAVRKAEPFLAFTFDGGFYLSTGRLRPYMLLAAGAGHQVNTGYGAFAEGGLGVKAASLSLTVTYRGLVLPPPEEEYGLRTSGVYGKIGLNF